MEEIIRRQALDAERQAAEQRDQTLAHARQLVRENDRDPHSYIAAARTLKQLGHLFEALELLRKGIDRCPSSPALHEYYIERLEKCNYTEAAIAASQRAALLFPEQLIFRLREALLLPVFYHATTEVDHYRRRFAAGLHKLIAEVPLDTAADRARAFEAIGKNSNKYLAYQGQNDRELQTQYGDWVGKIVAANFPQWSAPVTMPAKTADGRLRIGYVSSRFREGSVTRAFLGWLRGHDREQFAGAAYHAGAATDRATEQWRSVTQNFRQLPSSIASAAQLIREDNLHVLVLLDLGMTPWMTQLAALRLAPVQCMAWDYPVTSGLPTIDYCVSGELMEPEDAASHYSEQLVTLPGVGVCYSKPVIPKTLLLKTRRDFGLREDGVVYLSPQTVFKYLPQQDHLFAQIAKRVPNSQFVFLVTNEVLVAAFRQRLQAAFSTIGLDAGDHCVLMPEVSQLDYWNLQHVSDVVLDTIGWSGGISTFDAVACGIPIVTLPGKFMRGRQSYGILSQLGVTDTIAGSEADYVEIGERLGNDFQWRKNVTERMAAGFSDLFSDTRSIRALENFYRDVFTKQRWQAEKLQFE